MNHKKQILLMGRRSGKCMQFDRLAEWERKEAARDLNNFYKEMYKPNGEQKN